MKDTYISVDPSLTLAEQAVSYVLRRIQVDADLRWHMVGTEAFHKLCEADAERRHLTTDEVTDQWSTPPEPLKDVKPEILALRKRVEILEDGPGVNEDVHRRLADESMVARVKVRSALALCPTCAGLPEQAITRCKMCRQLQEIL